MKVIVVDDEQEIREGLAGLVRGIEVNGRRFEVAATASHGNEALSLLAEFECDLAITDIRMPGENGLNLAETILYRYPGIRVMIVSGYGDMAYMQRAIRLGVSDYLVKPIVESDLREALGRLMASERKSAEAGRKISLETFAAHEHAFKAIVACDLDDADGPRAREIGHPQPLAWIVRKAADEAMAETDGLALLQDGIDRDPLNLAVGAWAETEAELEERIGRWIEGMLRFCRNVLRIPASFGVSGTFGGREDPQPYLLQAGTALFSRVLEGHAVRCYRLLPPASGKLPAFDRLKAAIERMELDEWEQETRRIVDLLLASGNIRFVAYGIEHLLLLLCEAVHGRGGTAEALRPVALASSRLRKLIWSRNKADLLRTLIEGMTELLQKSGSAQGERQIVARAKQYAAAHFRTSVTLQEAARHAYVTPQYLSRLFRESTGMTFLEYVTKLRIEEAKRLLGEPGIKIYEVSEQVGYGNWKHFSRTFKELTGCTPADYRNHAAI
jgi:two-component system response regulator YesN